MTLVAVPNFGNYTIAIAASVESLGVEPWSSMSTPETARLGMEAAPESTCLPFKANLGHFIKAAMDGAEYAVMVNSIGTCRLRYYRDLQQKILDETGVSLHIFSLGYDGFKPPLVRFFDPSHATFLKGVARAAMKMFAVDQIEVETWRVRARELYRGQTSQLMHLCLDELRQARTLRAIRRIRRSIAGRYAEIPIDSERTPLKIALVGEATVLRDKFLNHNIEDILGTLGVEAFNYFIMGVELRKIFNVEFGSGNNRRSRNKMARPYLKSDAGGHSIETIANTIRAATSGYDGVIHVYPTGCMPEVSIKPMMKKISDDYAIPLLECSFDEHTSQVGIITRIETFVDLIEQRKKRMERQSR